MLLRWTTRSPRRSPISFVHARYEQPCGYFRSNSSSSNKSRSFPGSNEGFRLRPWQRAFLVGIGAGFVAGQGLLYYNRNQLNNSFLTYKLVAKEPVSSTASIFHLDPTTTAPNSQEYDEVWKRGIWNVHFKQPQIQIVRAYTPLPPVKGADGRADSRLRFLIRHDPHGEVSSYLHRLPIGSDIELRGPNLEYELTPEVKQVVFFAGGTGIAPALQIAHAMFDRPGGNETDVEVSKNPRKLHILWASRKREDCVGGVSDAPADEPTPRNKTRSSFFSRPVSKPVVDTSDAKGPIVQELEDLKTRYPGRITVEYFVNAEDTWINEDAVFRSLSRFDDKDFSTGYATPSEQRQILISGPNGFITYLAGPKEWKNGREEQGPVGKIMAHAIAQNPHNVKVWKI